MALDDLFLSTIPDTTEVLDGLGVGPFQGGKITGNGGVFFDPVTEELDAVFRQLVPVDPDVGQEAAKSFNLVEGFLQAVFGRNRPLGEAGGSGGNQELNTPSQRAFGSGIQFPRETPEGLLDLLAKIFERSLDT